MGQPSGSFSRDANRVPIWTDGIITKRTITFAGATEHAWGDDGGDLDGGVVFTVTGIVKCQLIGDVTTDLVGGATIEVGITGATAIFCKKVTDTTIDEGDIYLNEVATDYYVIGEEQASADDLPTYLLNGQDIILTTTTTNTTSGVIDFYCIWVPYSDDGDVVATTT